MEEKALHVLVVGDSAGDARLLREMFRRLQKAVSSSRTATETNPCSSARLRVK